jgi:putative tricarboxylic transport membrane protein
MAPFARRGDFWSGLALAALGTYIVVEAHRWVYMGEDGPGPGFFPMWYGGAMVVVSLFLALGTVLKPGADRGKVDWADLRRAFTCWIAFIGCVALMRVVGFVVAFGLLTWFITAVMARERQRVAIPVAVGGAVLFYLLFELALDVSLPKGMLF